MNLHNNKAFPLFYLSALRGLARDIIFGPPCVLKGEAAPRLMGHAESGGG
ncbi:MAG TPA: hypothetical protein VMU18_07675 [Rhodoblastus sp.]|nr:hypothetical protein [Rhodoblastus sp.]